MGEEECDLQIELFNWNQHSTMFFLRLLKDLFTYKLMKQIQNKSF